MEEKLYSSAATLQQKFSWGRSTWTPFRSASHCGRSQKGVTYHSQLIYISTTLCLRNAWRMTSWSQWQTMTSWCCLRLQIRHDPTSMVIGRWWVRKEGRLVEGY